MSKNRYKKAVCSLKAALVGKKFLYMPYDGPSDANDLAIVVRHEHPRDEQQQHSRAAPQLLTCPSRASFASIRHSDMSRERTARPDTQTVQNGADSRERGAHLVALGGQVRVARVARVSPGISCSHLMSPMKGLPGVHNLSRERPKKCLVGYM